MESFGLWYKLHKDEKRQDNLAVAQTEAQTIKAWPAQTTATTEPTSKESVFNTAASNEASGEYSDCTVTSEDKASHGLSTIPSFDFHANFWSEDIQITDEESSGKKSPKPVHNPFPFLDIGIKIRNWKDIDTITFHCPFELKKEDLTDLTSELREQETEELIFNDTCRPEISGDYCLVRVGDEGEIKTQRLLLFPLSLSDGDENMNANTVMHPSFGHQKGDKKDSGEKETDLIIDFTSFSRLLGNDESKSKPKSLNMEVDCIYIRFRISSNELKNKIYFDSNPYNKSFESAFTSTRILDFKLNEERNLSQYTKHTKDEENSILAKFNAVHFLVMVPSYYDAEFFPDKGLSCRELEKDQWDAYYGRHIDTEKEHVLAYHIRQKPKAGLQNSSSVSANTAKASAANDISLYQDDKLVESFSSLIKIKSYKSNKRTVFDYILIVIALGMISSGLVTLITEGIDYFSYGTQWQGCLISVGIGFIMLLYGIYNKGEQRKN